MQKRRGLVISLSEMKLRGVEWGGVEESKYDSEYKQEIDCKRKQLDVLTHLGKAAKISTSFPYFLSFILSSLVYISQLLSHASTQAAMSRMQVQ